MKNRMQFSDYIVSYALQMLNGCLLRLHDGPLSMHSATAAVRDDPSEVEIGKDLKLIAGNAEKLLSLWQLVQWSVGKLQYRQAQKRLQEILGLVAPAAQLESRGAAQLLQIGDEKACRAVAKAMQVLAVGETQRRFSRGSYDRLNSLLQEESASWRDYAALRQIPDAQIIDHGAGRAYARGQTLLAALAVAATGPAERGSRPAERGGRPPGLKRLRRTQRWVRHTLNHLELLRPALSESGKARRWHLERLSLKLDAQLELECFSRAVEAMSLKVKTQKRLADVAEQRRKRINKQRHKLCLGAYASTAETFVAEVESAVAELGLQTITLLQTPTKIQELSAD
ncbi:MAG: hypothetical protein V3T18_11510 [Pseudomonadales bacterium]